MTITQCDGQKPVCSTCVQSRLKTCVYDMCGDTRRTSALEKRIEHLLDDITKLRDIILVLTRHYNIPHDQSIVQKIEQTLCHGKWSYLPELSRVLEDHISTMRPIAHPSIQLESGVTHPLNHLATQSPWTLPSSGTQPSTADGIVHVYPAAQPPSTFSSSGTQPSTADGIVQFYPATLVPSSWIQGRVPPVPSVYVDNFQAHPFYFGATLSTN